MPQNSILNNLSTLLPQSRIANNKYFADLKLHVTVFLCKVILCCVQKQFVIQSAAHLWVHVLSLIPRWSTEVYDYYLPNIIDVAVFNKKENWLPTQTVIVRLLHNYGQLLPHDGMLVIPHHALSAHEMQNLVSDEIDNIYNAK